MALSDMHSPAAISGALSSLTACVLVLQGVLGVRRRMYIRDFWFAGTGMAGMGDVTLGS